MRVLLAGIVVAVLVVIPQSIASGASSGLQGKVLRGPISPVCIAGRPCQVPASVVLRFVRRGAVVARVRSAPTGEYRVALAPGVYAVTPAFPHPLWRMSPGTVRVPIGTFRHVNFLIDTGIR